VTIIYLGENGITVYPNPVKNNLTIQQSGTGRTEVAVTDVTGKVVYRKVFTTGTLQINSESWSNGVYMVRVVKNEEISSFKVVKQ
jgi:hypothetical protein